MWPFSGKCNHPLGMLVVAKDATKELVDEDFTHITYHFRCRVCRGYVNITYAKLNGGVGGFLNRAAPSLFPKREC